MTANTIRLDCVKKSFGMTEVIPELTAEIAAGEFTVILGPSGCGKSTLLNMIAGLERVSGGRIFIGEKEVQDVEPKDRGCAMVFQNYALYPHMSVAGNIGYSLKVARVPRPDRERRVRAAAEFVGLSGFLERRPSELSGGQRQRVAIARAIVREPQVLLFDEPLSNLDAQLRHDMRMELSELHMRIGATTVFVTHDQVEAMTLADRVLILNNGRVEQFASPHEHPCLESTVFLKPKGRFSCLFRSFSPGFPHSESAPLATARGFIPCQARRPRRRRSTAWPVWLPTSFRSPQPVGAGGGSTVHVRSLRSRTLARITSLRMMATSATLWCFPRAFSLSYRAFNSGLYVVAVKAAMYRTSRGRRRPPRICRGLADWPLSCA